jgi:hypothetical protein
MAVHRKSAVLTFSVMIWSGLLLSGLFFPSPSAVASPNTDFPPDSIDTHPATGHESPIYPSRRFSAQDTAVGLGIWTGQLSTSGVYETDEYFRYTMTFYDSATFAHEYNFTVTSNSLVGWTGGYKKLFDLGERNEPFVAVHGGALYQPSESFATLINWQRYQLSVEAGLEDLFHQRRHFRAQLGLSLSTLGFGEYLGFTFVLP